MQNAWIWIVVVVVILVEGCIWWQSTQAPATNVDLTPTTEVTPPAPPPAETGTSTSSGSSTESANPPASGTAMTAAVSYTASGFSPATVTIKKGGTVTWTGTDSMWIASAPHPAHTGYDATSRQAHCAPGYTGATPFDECAPGASYSFTFDKVGTWPYHDHMNASSFGKVVVVE